MTGKRSGRMIQMDLLRIIACVMVVVMHVVADGIYVTAPGTFQWYVLTGFMAVCRPAVPVFFILSGMFAREANWSKSVRKALRYLLVFCIAMALYQLPEAIENGMALGDALMQGMHQEKYHLWFLREYILMLLYAPFVTAACERQPKLAAYGAGLFVVGTVIMQSVRMRFGGHPAVWAVIRFLPDVNLGYMGYFLMGRLIMQAGDRISARSTAVLCAGGVLGAALVFVMTHVSSMHQGALIESYYSNFFLGVFLMAAAWTVLFLRISVPAFWHAAIGYIAPRTLGIYLVHVFVIDTLTKMGFHAQRITTVIGVPLKTVLVFAISLGFCLVWEKLTGMLRRIRIR